MGILRYLLAAFFFIGPVLFVWMGVRSYQGKSRWWARLYGYHVYYGFAALYAGIAGLIIILSLFIERFFHFVPGFLYFLAVIFIVIAVAVWLWVPDDLLPRWFLEERAAFRRQEEFLDEQARRKRFAKKLRKDRKW